MRKALHIALVILAAAALSGCHRGGKIIPKGDFESLYADMLIADQWAKSNGNYRMAADTTLFYEPIFRRYGYTKQDFDATVSHYIDRPDKYVRIVQRAAKKLNLKYLEYTRIADRLMKVREKNRKGFGYVISDFANADSIIWGSTVLDSILIRDSVYIKPEPVDTLAAGDSLAGELEGIIKTDIINIGDVTRRDGIRTDKKPSPRKLTGRESSSDRRKDM